MSSSFPQSEAIDALIQQNDDVMARLSTSLRRVALLEQKLSLSQQENQKLRFQYESFKDQVMILKEKVNAISTRKSSEADREKQLEFQLKRLQKELQLAEIKYSEYYSINQQKQESLLSRIDHGARRLSRYLTYRERIQKASANIRQKMSDQINQLVHDKNVMQHNFKAETQHLIESHQEALKTKVEEKDFRIHELRRGLIEQVKELKAQHLNQLEEIKQSLTLEKMQIESELLQKIATYEKELKTSSNRLELTENTLKDLRANLAESTQYIQDSAKEFKLEKESLIENYEARIKKLYTEHEKELETNSANHHSKIEQLEKDQEKLQRENQKLFDRCTDLERVYEDNVQLQNKIVFAERKKDETQNKLHDEIEILQKSLSHYRSDAKSKSSELESLRTEKTELIDEVKSLKQANYDFKDQVEGLQSAWKDNQLKLEEENGKVSALQKLNQQLSKNLIAYKQEIKDLKENLENLSFHAKKQHKELQRSTDMDTSIQAIKTGGSQKDNEKSMSRVDSLIAEIQSGFNRNL